MWWFIQILIYKQLSAIVGTAVKTRIHPIDIFLKSHPIQSLFHILLIWAALFAIINKIPKRLNQKTGSGWTSTHQWTNVDGWCTDGCTFFVTPCLWANQDGELRLTLFFPSLIQGLFWGSFFFSSPLTPAQVSATHLCTLGLLPPPPTYSLRSYLPTCPPNYLLIHPSTYLPMYLHTKSPPRQWQHRLIRVLQHTQ